MKQKPFLLLLSLLLFAGCSDSDFDYVNPLPSANQKVSGRRSFQEALRIAENSTKMLSDKGSRSVSTVRAIDPGAIYYVTNRNSRSVGGVDTLMYVFNFANDAGFSLVPINENAPELLGVAEMGHYNPAEEQDNEGFQFYMESATAYLNNLPTGPILPADSMSNDYHYEFVRDTTIISVAPRIPFKWEQRGFMAALCENGVIGCANLALAMALAYVRQPDQLQVTFEPPYPPVYPKGSILNIDWDLINGHISDYLCLERDVQTTHDMLPTLMRQLGQETLSDYDEPGYTSTHRLRLGAAMLRLTGQNPEMFSNSQHIEALDSGCVAIICGIAENGDGHGWIYDGYYRRIVRSYMNRYRIIDSVIDYASGVSMGMRSDTIDYSHYNWGWGGKGNGYYFSDTYQPSNVRYLDDPELYIRDQTDFGHKVYYYYVRRMNNE